MPTIPFDQDSYPLELPPALLEVVALARELTNAKQKVTNAEIARCLGITLNAAYKRTRKLRDLGALRSHLMWHTRDNGSHPARQANGELWSWLEFHLVPLDQWGDQPDQIQHQFNPRKDKTND